MTTALPPNPLPDGCATARRNPCRWLATLSLWGVLATGLWHGSAVAQTYDTMRLPGLAGASGTGTETPVFLHLSDTGEVFGRQQLGSRCHDIRVEPGALSAEVMNTVDCTREVRSFNRSGQQIYAAGFDLLLHLTRPGGRPDLVLPLRVGMSKLGDNGQMVGSVQLPDGRGVPAVTARYHRRWQPIGPEGIEGGHASDINPRGQVAGWGWMPGQRVQAFIWQPGAPARWLERPAGLSAFSDAQNAWITPQGAVLVQWLNSHQLPYRYHHSLHPADGSAGRMLDFSALGDMDTLEVQLSGINARGQITGLVRDPNSPRAWMPRVFITGPEGTRARYLDTLVELPHDPVTGQPGQGEITQVAGLNRRGQLLVAGADGVWYLLTPRR